MTPVIEKMQKLTKLINEKLQNHILRKASMVNAPGWNFQTGKVKRYKRIVFEPKNEIRREEFAAATKKYHLPVANWRTRAFTVLERPKRGVHVKIEVHVASEGQVVKITNYGTAQLTEKDHGKIINFLKAALIKSQE